MVFQLGSALLDACVLAILQKEDAYGYKLTQEAKKVMNVSESRRGIWKHMIKNIKAETEDIIV